MDIFIAVVIILLLCGGFLYLQNNLIDVTRYSVKDEKIMETSLDGRIVIHKAT